MANRLSSREVRVAKVLNDGIDLFEAVRSFSTEESLRTAGKKNKKLQPPESYSNRWIGALRALKELSVEEGIPMAIIGGVAGVHHGYEGCTQDMGVVVSVSDAQRIIRSGHEYGFKLGDYNARMCILWYNGLKIDVVQEGMCTGDNRDLTNIPSPAELGVTQGLQFVSLEKWVHLKLASGRGKDLADIVEVLKRKNPAEIEEIEDYLMHASLRYAEKFAQLVETAEREKQQEARFLGQ
jgi:hypothetical protein